MAFPLPIPGPLRSGVPAGSSVLVALSGGVDSSVVLALLAELGCRTLAVTFKNFCYGEDRSAPEKACCSLEAIDDAGRVARLLGARHWVTDVTDRFRRAVIEPFVEEYGSGRTPNPCLSCNAVVRFPELVGLADQLGCDLVATGHYARVVAEAGQIRLLRAVDPEKDQAYFLHRIDRSLFGRLVFPVGWYRKSEVRRAARVLGLPVADKRESQEICFVPDGDRSFLFPGSLGSADGDIVTRCGRVLGRHRGLVHYTVGQRRGLGISAPEPLYVLALDRRLNRLIVGSEPELLVRHVRCDRFVAAVADLPAEGPCAEMPGDCLARVRHRHSGARVARWRIAGEELAVELGGPVKGVAPGQALVLYRGEIVLGGGRILTTA